MESLARHGFRGTSLASLAAECGTSHSNLLYYFGSKERLLHEVVVERERTEESDYEEARAVGRGSLAGLAWLRYVVRQNVGQQMLTRLYVVLAAENLDPGDPLHQFFVDRYERVRQLVVAAYQADVVRGAARPGVDTGQLAAEVIAVLMGTEVQWLMDPDHVDFVGIVDRYLEGLQARLAPDPGAPRRTRAQQAAR